jgi:hypothetical protein
VQRHGLGSVKNRRRYLTLMSARRRLSTAREGWL